MKLFIIIGVALVIMSLTDAGAADACSGLSGQRKMDCLDVEIEKSQQKIDRIDQQSRDAGDAARWLERRKADDPIGTDAAFQRCRSLGGDVSNILNCMNRTLEAR